MIYDAIALHQNSYDQEWLRTNIDCRGELLRHLAETVTSNHIQHNLHE